MNTLGHTHRPTAPKWLGSIVVLLMAACMLLAGGAAAMAAESAQPLVLVFDSVPGNGITKDLAASATRAVRTYFRETRKVDAAIITADSPSVLRAIMEKKLTAESLTSDTTREHRIEIAKTLGFDYAASAELVVKKDLEAVMQGSMPKPPKGAKTGRDDAGVLKADFVQVKVWLNKVSGKRQQWESTQSAMISGTKPLDMDNSMQSAVSAAILDLTKQAFAKVAPAEMLGVPSGDESVAISAPEMPTGAPPTAEDYNAKGDESLDAGNLALAIQQYSQAVSADPSNGKLRIKLAEAYGRKGLYTESKDELDRALLIGVDKALVDASRARVAQMQAGKPVTATAPTANPQSQPATQPMTQPATQPRAQAPQPVVSSGDTGGPIKMSRESDSQAVARLVQGDKLWVKGDTDAAALAYAEAIKLNPKDWRSYERLAAVNASMSLFGEARKAIEQLKAVQPNPSDEIVAKRYVMFRTAFDKSFAVLLKQFESDTSDFDRKELSYENYYASTNALGLRLESMGKYLDALTVPTVRQPANLRRSIACGLVAQATASMQDYLETNNKKSRKNADLFLEQAKKEADAAAKLEANKIVISRDGSAPQSTQPSQQDEGDGSVITPTVDGGQQGM